MRDCGPCANGFWHRKFGLEIDKHNWSLPSFVTKEKRLRASQLNILQNIYPTNILLCKMKVRDNQTCSCCNDVVDYIEQFFLDCPTIQKFWNYIEQYILITFDIRISLTVVVLLFGIKQHNYRKVKTEQINHIILIAKMCISIYINVSCTSFLPSSMIFENQLRL